MPTYVSQLRSRGGNVNALLDGIIQAMRHNGALVALSADEVIANATNTSVPWDQATYDTDFFWSSGSPTRLTVPANVAKVRLAANANWTSNATGQRVVQLLKNGASLAGGIFVRGPASGAGQIGQNGKSPALIVTPGDYFELRVNQTSGGNLNLLTGVATWFSIEVAE